MIFHSKQLFQLKLFIAGIISLTKEAPEAYLELSQTSMKYFRKKIHHICSTGFQTHL